MRGLLTVHAVQQNEHLDFLRDVVPALMPLSSALQARETRVENPELARLMASAGEVEEGDEADAPAAPGKPKVVRKAPSKPRAEKPPAEKPAEAPSKEDLAAARAARRLSRNAQADAREAGRADGEPRAADAMQTE